MDRIYIYVCICVNVILCICVCVCMRVCVVCVYKCTYMYVWAPLACSSTYSFFSRTPIEELLIRDGVSDVGLQQVLSQSSGRLVSHLHTILEHRHGKLETEENRGSLKWT